MTGVERWAGMVKLVRIELMLCGRTSWLSVARRRDGFASPLRLCAERLRVNAERFGFIVEVPLVASPGPDASREADTEGFSDGAGAACDGAMLRTVAVDSGRTVPPAAAFVRGSWSFFGSPTGTRRI